MQVARTANSETSDQQRAIAMAMLALKLEIWLGIVLFAAVVLLLIASDQFGLEAFGAVFTVVLLCIFRMGIHHRSKLLMGLFLPYAIHTFFSAISEPSSVASIISYTSAVLEFTAGAGIVKWFASGR